MSFLKTPSRSQIQAITHLSGPAQVIAGPGSGKTFTIVQRICYLTHQCGIRPDRILVITYTRAAAKEMKERYVREQDPQISSCQSGNSQTVHFGTFHSICYNILRQSGGVGDHSLIKENEKRKLIQVILGNMGLSDKCSYDDISKLLSVISRLKNLARPAGGGIIEDMAHADRGQNSSTGADLSQAQINLIRTEYDRHLREQGLLDFDDMITECLKLLSSNQSVCSKYQQLFQYILVDEFQDINLPQYQILKLLAKPQDNLLVVGDDDQAIYGFRGASPGIMKQFMEDFPTGRAICLMENYRSGSNIVELAGKMISCGRDRFAKDFHPVKIGGAVTAQCFDSRKEEEDRLIAEILASEGKGRRASLDMGQLAQTAVIVRTNREVVQYAGLLKEAGIAVKGEKIDKSDIFHGFIMEDISSFLRYLYEGNRRSDLIRFMNKPDRFFTREALPFEKVSMGQMQKYYERNPYMLSQIRLFFGQLEIAAGLSPALAVAFFRKTLGYDKYLRLRGGEYREYQRLFAQADKIQECFKEYRQGSSLKDFVEIQADKAGEASPKLTKVQGVSVLTMHGVKGLEYRRVFLPDLNEGVIPGKESLSESSIEEERRLLYVAITRAKDELFLFYTKERGRELTRFLKGLIPHPLYPHP